MHEAIITRGDVQGLDTDLQALIYDRHNCVLVHQECHDHSIKDVCIKHLIEKEGYSHIMSWLGLWEGILPDAMVKERMNRLNQLYHG